jgi:mediator of RNA polymerase II transcription subunit 12
LKSATDLSMEWVRRAGDLLRLLAHIANPFQEEHTPLQLDPSVQDDFITATSNKFTDLESTLAVDGHGATPIQNSSLLAEASIFLGRLVQFDLGIPGAWTPKTRRVARELSMTIFRIALVRLMFDFRQGVLIQF